MSTTLLIGNGINRVGTDGPSWGMVIEELATTLQIATSSSDLVNKPFPLFFDWLTLEGRKNGYAKSKELKSIVAQQLKRLEPGRYHERLMALGAKNVLTTNYDQTLEQALRSSPRVPANQISPKYNLFRRRDVGPTTVWHLHGCVDEPESILLGYDHYAGSVERMRRYLKREYNGIRSPFKKGIHAFETAAHSWIDVFLRDDVHIVGLALDYVEIDLWWVIYYKASLRSRGKLVGETHYYALTKGPPSSDERHRFELLDRLGVSVHLIPVADSWEAAWDSMLIALTARCAP